MTNESKSRRVNFKKFVEYIQKEYRQRVLNERDYEFIKNIAEMYPAEEIKLAIDYCKSKKTDSLIYLQDALAKKYYQNVQDEKEIPNWIQHPELCKSEPMTKEEEKELEEILKKYR